MFPDVRLLIAAVVASVVALSCGFAIFATFRVNHEPLSRLATGAAPLQLAAGNPSAATESFGVRFPASQADGAGAPAEAAPPQADHEDHVAPSSAVASTAATAPETGAAEPEQPAPEQPAAVAQAPATEPEAKQDEALVTPPEPPPALSSEPPPATTDTAATEPAAEQAAPAAPTAPTEQASQEANQETNKATNPETKPDTAPTAVEPPPVETHKAAHRHRLAAKAQRARQARATVQLGGQPSGIGGPFVPLPNRVAARPPPARQVRATQVRATQVRATQVRATVQPVAQPSGFGGPFVPPTNH
jgi:hypothetical protein